MLLKKVIIIEYGIHKELTLELHNKTAIIGPGGSGKTTIISAIYWCLTGKNPFNYNSRFISNKTNVSVELSSTYGTIITNRRFDEKMNEFVVKTDLKSSGDFSIEDFIEEFNIFKEFLLYSNFSQNCKRYVKEIREKIVKDFSTLEIKKFIRIINKLYFEMSKGVKYYETKYEEKQLILPLDVENELCHAGYSDIYNYSFSFIYSYSILLELEKGIKPYLIFDFLFDRCSLDIVRRILSLLNNSNYLLLEHDSYDTYLNNMHIINLYKRMID